MIKKCQLVEGRLQEAVDGPVWLVIGPDEVERRQLVEGLAASSSAATCRARR